MLFSFFVKDILEDKIEGKKENRKIVFLQKN